MNAVLPAIGDAIEPRYVTGTIGMDRFGLELVRCHGDLFFVLCFAAGEDDDPKWKVVAVIPPIQMRFLARWIIAEGELL